MVHHLVRVLEAGGEASAAVLLAKLAATVATRTVLPPLHNLRTQEARKRGYDNAGAKLARDCASLP